MKAAVNYIIRTSLKREILIVAITLLAAGVPAREVSDSEVTSAIESELLFDDAVAANRVDLKTREGIVTLSGNVKNILAKERAEELAGAIVGVRAVINQINVLPPLDRSDEDVAADIELALMNDPAVRAYEVTSTVRDGVVTLTGTVDSYAKKELSETVVKGVQGVVDVNNKINVVYEADREDYQIKAEVEARLKNDIRVDDYLITVDVNKGTVKLAGKVGSLLEKNRARQMAWVAGVRSVDLDELKVTWRVRDEMRRKALTVSRSDQEIEQAVKDAFFYDPRLYSFHPSVEVRNGIVMLSGHVPDARAKRAAEQDARNTAGVRRVRNNLKVRVDVAVGDARLKERVDKVLTGNSQIDRSDLTIEADSGWVTLSGRVQTSYEKYEAERLVLPIAGVEGVINNIEYKRRWTRKPDRELRDDVKSQLFWSVFVDADDISVSVSNGVVTLTGAVGSWSEYDDAEKNAYQAGAKTVENKLDVSMENYYGPAGPLYYGGYTGNLGYGYAYPYGYGYGW
jgi:osmotically-inducible protein OsmY